MTGDRLSTGGDLRHGDAEGPRFLGADTPRPAPVPVTGEAAVDAGAAMINDICA